MRLHITKDERYPDYALVKDEETGWIPGVEIPAEAFTAEDVADYQRIEALYDKWQRRLGKLYQEAKAKAIVADPDLPASLVKAAQTYLDAN